MNQSFVREEKTLWGSIFGDEEKSVSSNSKGFWCADCREYGVGKGSS